MEVDQLTPFFIDQGVLGVIVLILIGAIGFLARYILQQHKQSLEQNTEVVKALVESAHASSQVARSMDQTNEFLRTLLATRGGS